MPPSTPPPVRSGRLLADRYELLELLGTGGMGTVWSARDTRLGREVAIKRLRADLDADAGERLRREARAAAGISDRRVVTVLDLDRDENGEPFLVLERHEGTTLADELRDGPVSRQQLDRLVEDLLGALDAAHRAGVLHRDVKPANILRDGDDGYRVTDFGLASSTDDPTTETNLFGTLVYVAPERLAGHRGTVQADLFAAAIVIHEAATGTHPFRADNVADSIARLRSGDIDELPDTFPAPMRRAILAALAADPADRPVSAGAMLDACHAEVSGDAFDTTQSIDAFDATQVLTVDPPTAVLPTPLVDEPEPDQPVHDQPVHDRTGPVREPTIDPAPPTPAPSSDTVTRTDRPALADRLRRTSVEQRFAAGCALLLVALFAVLLTDGSDDPITDAESQPAATADAPESLDGTLDRIVELGR